MPMAIVVAAIDVKRNEACYECKLLAKDILPVAGFILECSRCCNRFPAVARAGDDAAATQISWRRRPPPIPHRRRHKDFALLLRTGCFESLSEEEKSRGRFLSPVLACLDFVVGAPFRREHHQYRRRERPPGNELVACNYSIFF